MTMRGIDISNWQQGLDLNSILGETEFVICKATGGTSFIDRCCNNWIETCLSNDKPFGFYHFGNDDGYNEAYDEAKFFIENCKEWFGLGIPILDWEKDEIDCEWVNTFVNIVHSETGIWCWIYGNAWRFSNNVEQNCGRWVASYPSSLLFPDLYCELPEAPEVNGLMCAWQFASDCQLENWYGNIDGNIFYGDRTAWNKYAGLSNNKIHILEDDFYKVTIERKK